jgi:hypothetical protein
VCLKPESNKQEIVVEKEEKEDHSIRWSSLFTRPPLLAGGSGFCARLTPPLNDLYNK